MSNGLAPSKSTVYISNLPYDLKNNDIHKLFEKHGRIIKVTVLKDKQTRKSKGVAFLLFLKREDAKTCAEAVNMNEMFGRTLKASIAKDNGRSAEFIRRKDYPNKGRCFECGEFGHLSYACSQNLLGEREPPPKKVRKRKKKQPLDDKARQEVLDYYKSSDEERSQSDCEDVEDCETLSAAIALEQEKTELENYRYKVAVGDYLEHSASVSTENKRKIKKSSYFSDEEEIE